MMSYFSNYGIREHQPRVAVSTLSDLQCPVLQSRELGGQPEVACRAPELLDWLGAVFSGVELCVCKPYASRAHDPYSDRVVDDSVFSLFYDRNNESHNFISAYCCPQPSTVVARACMCTVTGFILPEKVLLLLEQLW